LSLIYCVQISFGVESTPPYTMDSGRRRVGSSSPGRTRVCDAVHSTQPIAQVEIVDLHLNSSIPLHSEVRTELVHRHFSCLTLQSVQCGVHAVTPGKLQRTEHETRRKETNSAFNFEKSM
jgi:hypothetical protein